MINCAENSVKSFNRENENYEQMSKYTENPTVLTNMLDYETHLTLSSEAISMGTETKIMNTQIKMYIRKQS
jgi:hypothetical protein